VARFGKRLPKWFIRTAYAFFDDQVGDADLAAAASDYTQWGPRVAHCWARLMAAMPEAVTPDPEVLGDLSLPYLRTAGDHDYKQCAQGALRTEAREEADYHEEE